MGGAEGGSGGNSAPQRIRNFPENKFGLLGEGRTNQKWAIFPPKFGANFPVKSELYPT